MKKIFKLVTLFTIFITAFVLTGCNEVVPYVTVQNATAIREKITVDFTIWDEEGLLDELKVSISGIVDGEDYNKTNSISFSGGEYATEEDLVEGEIELDDFIGEKIVTSFTNLSIGETYSVTFTATYNDKARKISPKIDSGKNFDLSKLVTTGEGGTKENAHQIKSIEDFDLVRDDPDGFFELKNDIDAKNVEITPFFSSSKQFVGDFDGGNFTIKNFKQDSYDQYLGLIGYIADGGVVYDLNIENATIKSLRHTMLYMGVVAGFNAGEIENVKVSNSILTSAGSSTGNQYVGLFVGYAKGNAKITDCSVLNTNAKLNLPANGRVGGFVGTSELDSSKTPEITDCTVTNVEIDVQIESAPLYTSELDAPIYISVGGFIGDNRGNITSGVVTDAEVYVYVKGTALASVRNTTDSETPAVNETEMNSYIDSMELRVGGFVGLNSGGKIAKSISDTSVEIENAYVEYIFVGGFVGENTFFSLITEATVTNTADYKIIVSEDTKIAKSISDPKTFGGKYGVDSASTASTYTSSSNSVGFDVSVRVSSTANDGAKEYTFKEVSVYYN